MMSPAMNTPSRIATYAMNSLVLNAGLVSSVRRTAPTYGSRTAGLPVSTAIGSLLLAGLVTPTYRRCGGAKTGGSEREPRCNRPCVRRTPVPIGQTTGAHASLDLDRRHLLRARHRARQALLRRPAQDGPLPPAGLRRRRAHLPEARQSGDRRRGAVGPPGQGLRDRAREVRPHRPRRAR